LSGSDDPLRHGHALLIGNSQYRDRAWDQLLDVPLQLDELEKGLKSHFDTVEVVKDLEIDALRQKVNGFLRSYGNDSNARLFIYYAGHGYTETLLPFNENRGYITGIDTPAVDGSERGYNAARLKAMSMMEIRSPLSEVLAKHILVVFDSCFSGTIFTSRAPNDPPRTLSPSVVARLMEKMARDIITAGSANERIPAHSPIPKLLLAALNGEADRYGHGVISAADIKTYLRDKVLNLPGVSLTPQQGRLQDSNFAEGEFLFRVSDTGSPVDHAAEAWAAVRDTTSIAILEQFRTLYARSIYAPFADARMEELKTQVSRPSFRAGGSPSLQPESKGPIESFRGIYGSLSYEGTYERVHLGENAIYHIQKVDFRFDPNAVVNHVPVAELKQIEITVGGRTPSAYGGNNFTILLQKSQPISVRMDATSSVASITNIRFEVPKSIVDQGNYVALGVVGSGVAWPIGYLEK
jgi:Caspase domain